MTVSAQSIRIGKRAFVLIPVSEYRRLRRLADEEKHDAIDFARSSIGRDLARKRAATGLSQAEVAKRASIRVETLSRLERGHANPTAATVKKVLRALGEKV